MRPFSALFLLLLGAISCAAASPAPPPATPPATPSASPKAAPLAAPSALDQIKEDARKLDPLVSSAMAKRFLARTAILPHVATRVLYHDDAKKRFFTEREAASLPAAERAALHEKKADEELYYNTKYGSPLSYSRPLDILFSRGLSLPKGSRMLDFGYGYVGHLRLLASLGIDATGVDVDPLLRALYSEPSDQGEIRGPEGEAGHVRLVDGHFPKDPAIVAKVGTGYDLVISKNVLKKGYIHPDRPADDKFLIHLGVSDEVVLKSFFAALKPGALMLVYNICPAPTPPDKPFIPWSDGRSPWSREQWEAAGFKVLVFDQDDTAAVRVMGHALGWDVGEDRMDLEHDLSVLYTLVERPSASR